MSDRQLRELQPQEMPLAQRVRPRSLPSQISAALLQPVYFFRTLPTMGETRQWLWVGMLILLLIGFSAVRQEALTETISDVGLPFDFGSDFGSDPTDGGDFGGGVPPDGGIPPDFGGLPPNGGFPVDDGGGNTASVTDTLTTGIVAASGTVVGWIVLTILLCEVSLLRGRAPRLGQNFQIAVWSTLPLALMALLQVLYYAAGGAVGLDGVSGLVSEWDGYYNQTPFVQAVFFSLASSLTIFWLWKLMLLYFGARFALNGRRWAALLVVVLWGIVSIVAPVVTGEIDPPESSEQALPEFEGELPFDDPFFQDDEEFDPFSDDSPSPESTSEFSNGGLTDGDPSFDGEDAMATEEVGLEFSTDSNPGSLIPDEEFSAAEEIETSEPEVQLTEETSIETEP